MTFLGRKYSPIQLVRESFLSEECRIHFRSAGLIFSNSDSHWNRLQLINGRETSLNYQLLTIYAGLADGVQVVSSTQILCNGRINDNNEDDISSMVKSNGFFSGSCSWKAIPVNFYNYKLDRTKRDQFVAANRRKFVATGRIKNVPASAGKSKNVPASAGKSKNVPASDKRKILPASNKRKRQKK